MRAHIVPIGTHPTNVNANTQPVHSQKKTYDVVAQTTNNLPRPSTLFQRFSGTNKSIKIPLAALCPGSHGDFHRSRTVKSPPRISTILDRKTSIDPSTFQWFTNRQKPSSEVGNEGRTIRSGSIVDLARQCATTNRTEGRDASTSGERVREKMRDDDDDELWKGDGDGREGVCVVKLGRRHSKGAELGGGSIQGWTTGEV